MKLRREVVIFIGVLLVLLVVTAAAGLFESKAGEIPPLSSDSNLPDGARALRLWLAESGYKVSADSGVRFALPEGADVALILEPDIRENISEAEWETLDEWVSAGGTLLLASRQIWRPLINSPLGVGTEYQVLWQEALAPVAPIFQAPPMRAPAQPEVNYVLLPGPGVVYQPVLATASGLVALRLERGAGSVILLSDAMFMSNASLKDPGNAALTLNLFALIPAGSQVWFDEWHHGQRAGRELYGPQAWLTGTPAGFAVLFSAGVIFLGLLLAGRPFGRPVPLPQEQVRRASLEYVTALANLNRRAGHRRALLLYYHSAIKRAYGRRYRLDPGLPDPAYVAQLTHYNPALDGPALLSLLQRLAQKDPGELALVQLAKEAADWLVKLER